MSSPVDLKCPRSLCTLELAMFFSPMTVVHLWVRCTFCNCVKHIPTNCPRARARVQAVLPKYIFTILIVDPPLVQKNVFNSSFAVQKVANKHKAKITNQSSTFFSKLMFFHLFRRLLLWNCFGVDPTMVYFEVFQAFPVTC